ncbi:oxidoreductase family protein [Artemisia annua]|uniref:Oxidoreductase family protein n=1 Tax=Artemisia annua TaxID=35608 RepID=A0A2U1PSU2_ARTAN|nr:oxidoreductase family protein [Artemisia annua]
MSDTQKIRFGILGCAEIARKLSRAITLSPLATLYAIGSRSLQKATTFAASNNFPPSAKIYGSYEDVLNDPNVDAVYVPLPTSLHVKWAVLAAEKKKHVLLEKPVALNVGEFDVILDACEKNGVQLMDSTMWMHHPRATKMKEFLSDANKFGELKSMNAIFTFAADPDFLENDIRVKPDLDALGALGDAGWYCARSILWAADFNLPKSVTALPGTVFNKAGVIISCGAALQWEDGKVATFHCSFLANLTMSITASGTKEKQASFKTATESGFTELVTGWLPFRGVAHTAPIVVPPLLPLPSKHTVMIELPQEALMVTEFSRLVKSIKNDGAVAEKKWPTLSRKTQCVLDAVKTSIDKGGEPVILS